MHGRRRRKRDLWRDARDLAQKLKFVERQRLRALQLGMGIRRCELDLVPVVVAKLEIRGFNRETFYAFNKTAPIGSAPEFAIGHHLQTDLFLPVDGVANALVLHPAK